MKEKISIAFAGQPNSGKSTLFNMMTGARQHVANYPGITVEKKTGEYRSFEQDVFITDLPGTYSLTSYSPEERVSRNFILNEKPQLIVNITDGSNLERHLYLTFQLLEMQRPLVMYMNKMDAAHYAGLKIDTEKVSQELGIPVIAGSAKKKEKITDLKQKIFDMSGKTEKQNAFQLTYSDDMEASLRQIIEALQSASKVEQYAIPLRWLAVKLCEKDSAAIEEHGHNFENFNSILQLIQKLEIEHKEKHKHSFEIEVALARSAAAKKIVAKCVEKFQPEQKTVAALNAKRKVIGAAAAFILFFITYNILNSIFLMVSDIFINEWIRIPLAITLAGAFIVGAIREYLKSGAASINSTDRVDRVLCHRFFGVVILIELVLVFYWITVVLGYKMTDRVFPIFKFCRTVISQLIPANGIIQSGLIRGLLLNGIIDGAIMILNYVPIFFCLFALVAFLEDVGYMARLAFIMDRILRKFGLHGQSTLPMILSGVIMGGCVVPGVMSTRTIRDDKSRLVTLLILPLLNCMAKIPFYALITGIFFAKNQWLVLGGISFFTLAVALIVARYFSLYVVSGTAEPFVLELPSYNLPTLRGILIRTFERLWSFIKKVATTVVAVSVVIWAGVSFPSLKPEKIAEYETKKNNIITEFSENLDNSYSQFFTNDKGFLDYEKINERLYLMKALNWFGSETWDNAAAHRIFMENPEMAKIALRGKLELGDTAQSFKEYLVNYIDAYNLFVQQFEQSDEGTGAALKNDFYAYWQKSNPFFFAIVRNGRIKLEGSTVIDSDAAKVSRNLRAVTSEIKSMSSDLKRETLENSLLGKLGKFVEPVTKYAGFDWRINIAILGSFAAKEALVSTLGTIYSVESGEDNSGDVLEERIQNSETGMTPLDGLAIMILISLFPPCIATVMATHTETQSIGWTLFSILYPVVLSSLVAVLVFQIGTLLGF